MSTIAPTSAAPATDRQEQDSAAEEDGPRRIDPPLRRDVAQDTKKPEEGDPRR
jgi:hypothetical protein